MKTTGTIKRIIGPVVDVDFGENLPDIYTALEVTRPTEGTEIATKKITLEVEQHLGGGIARTVAMDTTDGLSRGMEVVNTGAPISVPVGSVTLGRIFNVLGEVIDDDHLTQYIRYQHTITAARWSGGEKRWKIEATRVDTGERLHFSANFLWMCQGYYRHARGHTPDWPPPAPRRR